MLDYNQLKISTQPVAADLFDPLHGLYEKLASYVESCPRHARGLSKFCWVAGLPRARAVRLDWQEKNTFNRAS